MKKQLSSLDLHFLVSELKQLEDSRIDRIYQPEKQNLVIQLYKTNAGKKILNIIIGECLFLADSREETAEPHNFCMLLRKHLDGYWLRRISQIDSERIVEMLFSSKDDSKSLYFEFFGKGNAVLCDKEGVIINALEHHEFKDRAVKPKIEYNHPKMQYNFLNLKVEDVESLFENSKTENVVKCLAVELGFGGVYAEEICLLSNIDKTIDPKRIDEKSIKKIYSTINEIINNKIEAKIILKNNEIADVNPFELEFYKDVEKKDFDTFNEALNFFYSHFKPKVKSEYEKRIEKLNRIIEEQKKAVDEMKTEEIELRAKGELIYHNYQQIKEILDELNKAAKKYTWKEIKEKLKGHNIVKEVNEKDRKVVVEI